MAHGAFQTKVRGIDSTRRPLPDATTHCPCQCGRAARGTPWPLSRSASFRGIFTAVLVSRRSYTTKPPGSRGTRRLCMFVLLPAAGLPAWINQCVGVCVACCVYTLARGQNSPWGTCAIPLNDASVCLTKCRRGRLKRVRPARLSPCPPAPSPGLRWNSGSRTALPPHPAGSWSAPSSGSPAGPASW